MSLPLYHKFVYWYGDPIPILPWPKKLADVPAHLDYFAIHISRKKQTRELPFAWKVLARLNTDTRDTDKPEDSVWIGRRMLPE